MSEKINPNVERTPEAEQRPRNGNEHIRSTEREPTKAEREHGNVQHIEKLKASVIEKAAESSELKAERESKQHQDTKQHPVMVNKHLKDMSYHRALTRARKKLSAPTRLFSRAVHSALLEKSSETASKTIARPSSMLGGAFLAFASTSALLWATRKYGYEYNYLVVILVFAIGMILGLGIEGAYRFYKRRSR